MYDITQLYDDLVAIRRTANVMHEEISQESRNDLQAVLERIKGKLKAALVEVVDSRGGRDSRRDHRVSAEGPQAKCLLSTQSRHR